MIFALGLLKTKEFSLIWFPFIEILLLLIWYTLGRLNFQSIKVIDEKITSVLPPRSSDLSALQPCIAMLQFLCLGCHPTVLAQTG